MVEGVKLIFLYLHALLVCGDVVCGEGERLRCRLVPGGQKGHCGGDEELVVKFLLLGFPRLQLGVLLELAFIVLVGGFVLFG